MAALIQFKIGPDGNLELVMHKALWEEVRKSAAAEAAGDFMRIQLTGLTAQGLRALSGMPGGDQPPCRPIIQFDVAP